MIVQIGRKRRRWREQIRGLPVGNGFWRYSRGRREDDPAQGWKIHLAATVLSASDVFSRAQPILRGHDALFKVPATLDRLAAVNAGVPQFSQIGKFLTVYPRSADEATTLARKLHRATRGLRGPGIPFDARYRKNSIVYYRYGNSGNGSARSNAPGTIADPSGRVRADKRAPGCAVPHWLDDPFQRTVTQRNGTHFGRPLAPDYLVLKVMAQRGKGAVYEALDFSAGTPRLVIVKEGRAQGETAWDGVDGRVRVKHESRVLRLLRAARLPVPKVLHEFDRDGHRYVILAKIEGSPLLPRNRVQPAKVSWRRAAIILGQLELLLSRIHAAGWVWRDCKPSHVFVRRGRFQLLDFEGACRTKETDALPWGSRNYLPRACRQRLRRRPGFREDNYALGVIAFQFGTGQFPPAAKRGRAAIYARTRCPDVFRVHIEQLLDANITAPPK